MYEYTAKILGVHDGDTCTALMDLGFRISQEMPLRLVGIDAPELSTPGGKEARDHLRSMIDGKTVIIRTEKNRKEKYGRYLALIWVGSTDSDTINIKMIQSGNAKPYDGGKKS